ncbi:MAG TPA: hypothetical protein VJR27_01530 [Candidatus Saccharimonadales bacterium]|nr:hypothetical protein [Candidatus Saccharimonadales bacterium]
MTYNTICQYFGRVRGLQRAARVTLTAVLVSTFTLVPAAAASAATGQAGGGLKSAPVAPADSPNGVTAPVAGKDQAQAQRQSAGAAHDSVAVAWTAGLSASSTNLWPTQYSTLTATANQDVGPTPYYLSIYDVTAASYIKICGSGTTCSISVTQPTATTHSYRAYISSYPTTNPPANQQAYSSTVTVTWHGVGVSLSASPTTVAVNGNSTLTATATQDVGPSPFYIQIFDATTGARLTYCGFGTTCSVATSQAVATTHKFLAFVSNYSTSFYPAGIQATSNLSFVTWTAGNYRLSLGITAPTFGTRTLTAYSNINVGPTPYYIEIFNLRTGARVAVCGSGTTCSTTVSLAFGRTDFAAFTSSYDTALPPLNTQASSNVVSANYFLIPTPFNSEQQQ